MVCCLKGFPHTLVPPSFVHKGESPGRGVTQEVAPLSVQGLKFRLMMTPVAITKYKNMVHTYSLHFVAKVFGCGIVLVV